MAVQKACFKLPVPLLFVFLFSACTVVKNVPANRPFIYETKVQVTGDLNDEEKKELALRLMDQLHDSVKVRAVAKFAGWDKPALIPFLPFIPRFLYEVRDRPSTFDSLNADKSIQFMEDYMHSLGYYRDSVKYEVRIDTLDNGQLRTYLNFRVTPGIPTRLDSIAYRLDADTAGTAGEQRNRDTIQKITLNNLGSTLIKKGDLFSKYSLAAERDRLANVYRNNGYLGFSEEELLVLWDTVGIELLRPTLDPIEQATALQRLAERRANPVADVEFHLRENPDSTRITRYYIGNVSVLPEFTVDTTVNYRFVDTVRGFIIKQNENKFRPRIFPNYIFLNPGELYSQLNVARTQNKFNTLAAWRVVSIQQLPRAGQDTADFEIRLTPARKYGFNANLEVSRNQGNISIAQGNLIGLGVTAGVQNRNFARAANQSSFNFRFGTELNATIRDLIQTRQINFGYSLQIPRLVPRFVRGWSRNKENNNASILTLNAGRTDRRDYFSLTTLNASWGYQFNWGSNLLNVRFPNLEYNYLQRRDSLDTLIARNASYKYIFNTGVIVSLPVTYTHAKATGNVTRLFTANAELAGLPGQLRNAFATNLYRFAKLELEYRKTRKIVRNSLAYRFFGGAGWSIPFSRFDSANFYLPFFRQYFAGGPNSMRAWSIRRLGPGSAIKSFDRTKNPDRFGDVRLEANLEYRIYLTNYRGIGINTAVFTDVGNVWFIRQNPDFPGGEFPNSFGKLWKDIGIGLGTGLRVDFGFFKIRLDYAYKVKNPTPEKLEAQNRWFYGWQLFNGQVQLGIDYPF